MFNLKEIDTDEVKVDEDNHQDLTGITFKALSEVPQVSATAIEDYENERE